MNPTIVSVSSFHPSCFFPSKAIIKPLKNWNKNSGVISNHFSVELGAKGLVVDQWSIEVSSIEKKEKMAEDHRSLIDEVLRVNASSITCAIGKFSHAGKSLYSISQPSPKSIITFNNHKSHTLTLTLVLRELNVSDPALDIKVKQQLLQVMNVGLKTMLQKAGLKEFGQNRQFYDPKNEVQLTTEGVKLKIMKGFKTAFDFYEGGLRLMVDCSTRILQTDNLWTAIKGFMSKGATIDSLVDSHIRGRSFITLYGNQKILRMDGLSEKALEATAPFPDKNYKDYIDYFTRKYHLEGLDVNQPLISRIVHEKVLDKKTGETKEVQTEHLFLPELLQPVGLTDQLRANFRAMKQISMHTIIDPKSRFESIGKLIGRVNSLKEKPFDIKVQQASSEVPAFKLPPPRIISGNNASQQPIGSRINLNSLAESKILDNWVIIHDPPSSENISMITENFKKAGKKFGVHVIDPLYIFKVEKRMKVEEMWNNILKKCPKTKPPTTVLLVLTRKNANLIYKEAKRYFNSVGVFSQFFVSFDAAKDQNGLTKYSNLLLQMIAKTGKKLWKLEFNHEGVMILGADVFHARGSKSVASVTSQFGENLVSNFSTVRIQRREYQEVISAMSTMVLEHVEHYRVVKKRLPTQLVFFRDGVGESMIEVILEKEVKKTLELLEKKFGTERPKLTQIHVTKRIDDRFSVKGINGLTNPDQGLLVTEQATKSERVNFFLVAQKVNQGTANPTHYEVVYDEANMDLAQLCQITHDLTWNYFNWFGPVKVPSPVQYAHKLCALVGEIQDTILDSNLKTSNYYL